MSAFRKKNRLSSNPFAVGAFLLMLLTFTMVTTIAAINLKQLQLQAAAMRYITNTTTSQTPKNLSVKSSRQQPTDSLICTEEYKPVCGDDGKTYPNQCYATRAQQEVACEGRCPCQSLKDKLEEAKEEIKIEPFTIEKITPQM